MKKIQLKWIFIGVSLLMMLFMVACQQTNNQPQNENKQMILATTTSTQDSGLLDVLIPIFEEQSGYNVKTIAVGTGQALAMGEKGEADALLVHAPKAEQEIVDKGVATNRKRVMYNDFIIVGPLADPASIIGLSVKEGFQNVAESGSLFVSRGDDSGTHKKELQIWSEIGVNPEEEWYIETGQGMGATLQITAEREGYTLTDRATYLALKNQIDTLQIVIEGDQSLLNIYHVMQVNPEKFDLVNGEAGEAFVSFMISPEIQELITSFGVEEYGEPLFFPDAE